MAPASSPAPASKWLFSVVYVLFFSSFFFVFNPPPNFFVGGIHHCGLNASGLGKLAQIRAGVWALLSYTVQGTLWVSPNVRNTKTKLNLQSSIAFLFWMIVGQMSIFT